MIVKIGDQKYDSEKEPIMIELSIEEREIIANMDQNASKYCSYPEGMEPQDVAKFMEVSIEEEGGNGSAENKTDDGAAH